MFTVAGVLLLLSSCSIKEEVQVHANNSVGRDLNFKLDSSATQKLLTLAKQQNQDAGKMDSIGVAWDSLASTVKKNVQQIPGATATASTWDNKNYSGKMKFSLPSLDAYNKFAGNTLALPNDISEKVPVGGLKRETLTWKGKDTLLISLDNSRSAGNEAVNQDEAKQAMGFMKMMLGVEALMQYKVDFKLPKPAKAVIGEGAVLSADKKTVSYTKSLDESNEPDKADEIKVVF